MNVHEQFAEDLALYALGALGGDEKKTLESHLATCVECAEELRRLHADAAFLAMSAPHATPSTVARKRFMKSISSSSRSVPRRAFSWWAAAPTLGAVVLGFVSLWLWRQNVELRNDLSQAQIEARQRQREATAASTIVDVLSSEHSVRVTLVAAGQKPQPQVQAVYVPGTRKMVLTASDLPPVPAGRTYQLWVLPKQGKPIPSGTFRPNVSGDVTVPMPDISAGITVDGFAITVEPEGGSTTPTMPILFVGS